MNIPYIQQKISVAVSKELSQILETQVVIGRINPGLLNRIIIDDILIADRSDKEMVKISRLSAKYDIMPFLQGKISIGSVQLFGFDINLYRSTSDSETNFQFIMDVLASKDSIDKSLNIDLRINSFLIRRGKISYDVLSEPETPGKFNPKHIKLYNILGNISLKALQTDSINAQIKRLSLDEQSGIELRKLNFKALGNQENMIIDDFILDLPNSSLSINTIHMNYDSFDAFNNFFTDVRFNFSILPSFLVLQDLSPFIPALSHFKDKINIELEASGTIDQLTASGVKINVEDHIILNGNISLQDLSDPHNTFLFGKLSRFTVDEQGLEFLSRNFNGEDHTPSSFLSRFGNFSFDGEISGFFTDLVMYGNFHTDLGLIKGDVKFSSDKENEIITYSGGIQTKDFQLGALANNNKFGNVTFNLNVGATFIKNGAYPAVEIKGLIAALEFSEYTYENISLDGEYRNGGFNGHIEIDDENGSVYVNGSINIFEKIPTFNFFAGIKNVNPHALNLTKNYVDSQFSLNLTANFSGGNVEEMIGIIQMDSLIYTAPEKNFFMDKLTILSTNNPANKILSVHSSFLNANIQGNYSYGNLYFSFMNIVELYLPSLFTNYKKRVGTHNNFSFDINIFNTEILSTLFDIPLNIYNHSTIKGYINDETNRFRLEGHFPRLNYGKTFIESGIIIFENPSNELSGKLRFSNLRKNGVMNVSIDTKASHDKLVTHLNWGNNEQLTYSGNFKADTHFVFDDNNPTSLKTTTEIKQTDVIINDTIWKIHPSIIIIEKEKIHIDNFNFSRGDQFLHVDGYLSDDIMHSATVDLKDINLGYIFEIFNLRNIDFGGLATGQAHITRAFKDPILNTHLMVRDFEFNDVVLGDMDIYGEWNNEEEGIYLNAKIQEHDLSNTNVNGYIFPLKPKSGLDLNFNAQNLNVAFLQQYMESITSDLEGRSTGNVRLYGTFSTLNLSGSVNTTASMKVNVLNTDFSFSDSIYLSPTEMTFRNIPFRDNEGHTGFLDGHLQHQHFKNMTYRLNANVSNMLIMDTPESADIPFYGKVYATGNVILSGNADALNVDAAVSTNRNTNFVYSLAPAASATSNQFIKFVDKTPTRIFQDSIPLMSDFEMAYQREIQNDDSELDVRINIQVDATPDASVRIIMDPVSGDYISGRGNGNIRTEYYNKGDIKMFGNYNITQGIYKFSLQEVIRKDFIINEGSNIVFNGNPSDAIMNVQAIYTVNAVSLYDLVPSELIDGSIRSNVRVNCVMNLSGQLDTPEIRLAIELPNERDEVQALVRNYINTEEDVTMQVFYLLAIGKFYTPDYVNISQNSNMMSSMLSSTLSGQFNNMLSQMLNNNNWNIGTNLNTGDKGWTDVEIEGILSGQLLNNRLLINGNFGYRENPYLNTNFVGDFEAEWLLTRSGDIRLRGYNKTNDKYYIRTNLTTQGIGILFKRDFEKWNDLFFWKRKKIKIKTDHPQ